MWAGQKIYRYEEIDSTNLEAKRLAQSGAPHGSLVLAKRQSAGRGRRGRSWESAKEGNLYFSLLLSPRMEPSKASMLTLVMALSVAKAVAGVCREAVVCGASGAAEGTSEWSQMSMPGIKWPNDIVAGGRKLAGILTEMNLAPTSDRADGSYQVIVGVGINVVKQEFSEAEVAKKAVSLEEVLGKMAIADTAPQGITESGADGFELQEKLLADSMKYFENYYEQFCRDGNLAGLKEEYETFLVNKDRLVRVLDPQGEYEGKALGINEVGELLVELPGDATVRTVYAGEVSVRGIYGYV